MAEVEMKTLVCPGPPEHEFEVPKGRGRPPRYCGEHKPDGSNKSEAKTESSRPAPGASRPKPGNSQSRPAPGKRSAPRVAPPTQHKGDEPVETKERATMTKEGVIRKLPAPGTPDVQSRAKAETAANRNTAQQPDSDQSWPRGISGRPMAKIEYSASELVPTGQYANVSVGPARITTFVDLDIKTDPEDGIFSKRELQILTQAANELAEIVEANVVAVQRSLVLESLQEQLSNGKS